MTPVALTIAGSDPSGGAGLQADLKTFHQHGVYGMSVVTLLTVQNTQSVASVQMQTPSLVLAQLEAVLSDIPPAAAKTGALGDPAVVEALAERAADFDFPLVIDPVMISKHGARLIDDRAARVLAERLLPRAFLITPNLQEAAALAGIPVEDEEGMLEAARIIAARGARHVLVKGGHLAGRAVDLLWSDGRVQRFVADRLATPHTHGTGCVYSAAITARLARGEPLVEAVSGAKRFVTEAIRTNPGLGRGLGPINLFVDGS
jgi:hydroxymethylpyrimidine/phosphomethylpyrimidine kinase